MQATPSLALRERLQVNNEVTEHNSSSFKAEVTLPCKTDHLCSVSVAQVTPHWTLSAARHPSHSTLLLRSRLTC